MLFDAMPSPWVKLGLIALVLASLGLKLRPDAARPPSPQIIDFARLDALSAYGFSLAEYGGLDGPAWVGSKGACRLEITTVSPLGWHRAAMAARAGEDELAYLYKGRIYQDQPVMLTKLDHYWYKLANYFDANAHQPAVFSIVTSPECAAQSIDTSLIAHQLRL